LMEIAYAHDVVPIAEKIAQAIQAPCQLDIGDLIVQPSIGIAIFPKDGSTAADLIQSADQAMYEAKRNRSGYAFAR
jgi:diguanylate cyclase (GGDEF)-like protein